MFKRLSFMMATVLSVLAIVSCNKEEQLDAATVAVDPTSLTFEYSEDGPESASQTIDLLATRDWTATISGEGVSISPASGTGSNDPQTITVTAAKNETANKVVTVTFSVGGVVNDAVLTVNVKGKMGDTVVATELALKDVYSATQGDAVKTSGLVVATNTKGFVLQDGEDYLLVYDNAATEPGAAIGNNVTVQGTVGKYGIMVPFVWTELSHC